MSNALALITGDIYGAQSTFERVLVDPSINFEREAGFALQIIGGSDYLQKIAVKSEAARHAVVAAINNVAAIGVSLNPAQKHAYLVPRKDKGGDMKVTLEISYQGLIEIAVSSGSILWAQAEAVYESEADGFVLREAGQPPLHPRKPFAKRASKGEVVGVYVVAKTAEGDFLTTWMTTEDINDIRDRSDAWKKFSRGESKSCPWQTDWLEMAKKTTVKRAFKLWPRAKKEDQRARLAAAVHYLNTDGGEGLADAQQPCAQRTDGAPWFDLASWIAKVKEQQTEANVLAVYHAGVKAASEAKDRAGYEAFKAAAVEHRHAVRANTIDMPEAA